MERVKKVKTRRVFDDDFKAVIVKMLNSGKTFQNYLNHLILPKIFFIVGKPTRI